MRIESPDDQDAPGETLDKVGDLYDTRSGSPMPA